MALNMTKGLIPLPPYQDRLIPDAHNSAWDNLGPRSVKGFVLHRMLGTLDGTDNYFNNPATGGKAGLTDFGTDSDSGLIYRWNDPLGKPHKVTIDGKEYAVSPNRSGWASGKVIAPWGDGLAFITKYGVNAVNRDQVSWEIDDHYNDEWSSAAKAVAAQACAHYAHDYGIPWDVFPIAPQDGFSFVRWHQEFTGPQEKICPGGVVMEATGAWIESVRAIMKKAQTADEFPAPYKWPAWDGLDHNAFKALKRIVTVKRGGGAECYMRASRDQPKTRANIPKGTKVPVIYIVKASDASRWYVHEAGHRMPMTHFEETFTYNQW